MSLQTRSLPTKVQPEEAAAAPVLEPFGPTTRRRQLVAALIMMSGSLPVAVVAKADPGQPARLHLVLVAVGITGCLAWLVDGRRYLGASSAALAVGAGFTLAESGTVDLFALVFGLLGAALLLISQVNPRAVGGSAGLLIYVAASSLTLHNGADAPLPRPLVFGSVMLFWGGSQLRRILSASRNDTEVGMAGHKSEGL